MGRIIVNESWINDDKRADEARRFIAGYQAELVVRAIVEAARAESAKAS